VRASGIVRSRGYHRIRIVRRDHLSDIDLAALKLKREGCTVRA
jgi:hypothetical protein